MQIPCGPVINLQDIGLASQFYKVKIFVVTMSQRITFQHKCSYICCLSPNYASSAWIQYLTIYRHQNKNKRK